AGPVLFSGYRLRPDLTAQARDGRWFVTSDIGSIGPAGELLVPRPGADVINTRGEKGGAAGGGGGAGTRARGGGGAGVGRAEPGGVGADLSAPPRLADIRAHVRGKLPVYAAPAALLLVPDLPLLPSGKPDREALRARAAEVSM